MAKYLIHGCQQRKWYIDKFLVPSMLEQGIKREDILIFIDSEKLGNLRAFIASSEMLGNEQGTWHLQDDVILASDFKAITEKYDKGIVCGFCNRFSEGLPTGVRLVRDMWYSFPCIRIPNNILKLFIEWLKKPSTQNKYRAYIEAGKFDDSLFRAYMLSEHPYKLVHNLYPNIVDNIDYLIGGTIANYQRDKDDNVNSLYYIEESRIEKLKKEISQNCLHD